MRLASEYYRKRRSWSASFVVVNLLLMVLFFLANTEHMSATEKDPPSRFARVLYSVTLPLTIGWLVFLGVAVYGFSNHAIRWEYVFRPARWYLWFVELVLPAFYVTLVVTFFTIDYQTTAVAPGQDESRLGGNVSLQFLLHTIVMFVVSCLLSYLLADAKRKTLFDMYAPQYLLDAEVAQGRTWELAQPGFIF